ncbi:MULTISPECIES: M1 family metallopeptidase [Alteromonas]|uniref:Aminopeptidase n=1 Tax=Alteromonas stellipolaris TaxID=233316 RepID=A0AAW7Z417_9ALTE|nr:MULTISPECIES: M1 family metallopeptidase [Alteromonas]AMJ87208.1 peptidase M1 [Alteromonas sp. Mac1]AMJ91070.1 peptidase M1 [Alteromonas sp. Mac2]ANB22067.1 peptidase M1 [Alteromonas stellipolaris]MDO6577208.1 M1 family metallopeptidase [Alteromonas stellipolaris]
MRRIITLFSCVLALLTTQVLAKDVEYRLPSSITPTFQDIHLTLDPDAPNYSGSTRINIMVNSATKKVGFYQQDLTVTHAELRQNERVIALNVEQGDYNINWGMADADIAPGKYTLVIDFEGKVNTSSDGMYLSRFEETNYIFTQFEDMHARKAFPSFDEPAFKIPYQMTITAPEKQVVVSNTPVESHDVSEGMQTVKFEKTKPMPTYLIAYTVGPFDSVELKGLSVPGKIYVPKGYADKTKFVVKHTPEILATLEDFFDIKYPYKKLDFVAVPNFTHGAMENVGLITYRDSLLLLADEPGLTERKGPLNVIAHELAHQWFGNLVTMAWWDDLWLNEAFASWAASYTMMELYPELNFADRIVQESAFGADASPTVKPVKKVVRIQPDVMDGLGLNYSKGESILQMIESLIGTEKFREGVRNYMNTHAWGNTVADDLWAALDGVSDINLSAMMKAYLEQPAYPLISIDDKGTITQERFHYAGATVDAQTWAVPLKLTYKVNGAIKQEVVFIDKAKTQLPQLAEADWVFPNDNATGYFRWAITSKQLDNLLGDLDVLNNREKKNVLYNVQALLNAGKVNIDSIMPVLNALAKDNDPVVKRAAVGVLAEFDYLVNDDNKANYAALLNQEYLPLLNELTLQQTSDESESVISLRNQLYSLLGNRANNETLIKQSESIAKQYIKDSSAVPAGIAGTAIGVTTKHSEEELYETLVAAFKKAQLPNVKRTLLYSMRYTDEATVNKMLDLALTDDITPANTLYMLVRVSRNLELKTVLYKWLNSNLDALIAKMPDYHVSRMPEFVSTTCSAENLDMAKAFYEPIKDKHEGMARSFDIMLDESKQCLRLKATYQEDFNKFLAKYGE